MSIRADHAPGSVMPLADGATYSVGRSGDRGRLPERGRRTRVRLSPGKHVAAEKRFRGLNRDLGHRERSWSTASFRFEGEGLVVASSSRASLAGLMRAYQFAVVCTRFEPRVFDHG